MAHGKQISHRIVAVSIALTGVLVWVAVSGCQKSAKQKDRQTAAIPRLASGKLPELGDYLPPLDGGRLELAPPKDWVVAPRTREYIVRFQADPGSNYPSVVVAANSSERFKTVTPENLEEFAKSVAAELETAGAKTTVKMGRLGNLIGVTYTRRAKVKGDFGGIVERLFFDTVVGDRRYKFELRCPPEMVTLAEPYFFAIVNGAKLTSVTELEEEALAGEESAPPNEKETPKAQPEQRAEHETLPASEKAQAEKTAQAPAEKPVSQASQETGTQTGKSPPASSKEVKTSQEVAPEAPTADSKGAEKPASEGEKVAKPAQAVKDVKEKPKEKTTEDLLKDVDSLLQ
ncbi:MAG: hypothetical protein ACUVQG_13730 [Thermogutta sp.]